MRRKITRLLVIGIIILYLPSALYDIFYVNKVSYVTFSYGEDTSIKIEDKKEVRKIARTFIFNSSILHACGYWFSLEMYDKNDKLLYSIPLNGECDDFFLHNPTINQIIGDCKRKLEKKYGMKITRH